MWYFLVPFEETAPAFSIGRSELNLTKEQIRGFELSTPERHALQTPSQVHGALVERLLLLLVATTTTGCGIQLEPYYSSTTRTVMPVVQFFMQNMFKGTRNFRCTDWNSLEHWELYCRLVAVIVLMSVTYR